MSKRKRVCIRRALWLLAVLIGSMCAWNVGAAIVAAAIHGWDRLPPLAVLLGVTWLMVQAAEWLGDGRR